MHETDWLKSYIHFFVVCRKLSLCFRFSDWVLSRRCAGIFCVLFLFFQVIFWRCRLVSTVLSSWHVALRVCGCLHTTTNLFIQIPTNCSLRKRTIGVVMAESQTLKLRKHPQLSNFWFAPINRNFDSSTLLLVIDNES